MSSLVPLAQLRDSSVEQPLVDQRSLLRKGLGKSPYCLLQAWLQGALQCEEDGGCLKNTLS